MNPQQAQASYDRAIRLHQQGKLVQAIQLYRKVIKAFPKLDAVHTNLGMALYQNGFPDQALRTLDTAIQLNPTNIDAYRNRAATLISLDRNEEAAEIYDTLVKSQPDDATLAYNYASLLFQMGKNAESERQFLSAIRADPELAQAHYNLGYLYLQEGRKAEAEDAFRKAVGVKPDYAAAYLNLGNLESEEGRIEAALANYLLAVEVQPDYVPALNGLAKAYYEMDQVEEGLEVAEKATCLDPQNADSWVMKGNALSAMGRENDGRDAFEKALDINPKHELARQNLARSVSHAIPGWHFTMLADRSRNAAYRKAIEGKIKEGDLVLDIGTGSGLLAMMAARAGASKVLGCEMVTELATVAGDLIWQNGYEEQIRVINRHSGTIRIGKDLPEKADVLVSEILDAAVIGEGVLPSHRHAVKELLKPGGVVIPARIECFVQLIALPELRVAWPVGEVEGFDLSGMQHFQRVEQGQVKHLGGEEYYPLSPVTPLWELDLAKIPNAVSEDHPETWTLSLEGQKDGAAHALAFWFDLWVDEETMVSSKPGGDLKHWGQTVYFFAEDIPVKKGEEVKVKVFRGELSWRFEAISINLQLHNNQ